MEGLPDCLRGGLPGGGAATGARRAASSGDARRQASESAAAAGRMEPGFLRTRLLVELRRRGVVLTCSRLYWNWYRGVVAEDVTFGAQWGVR